jgi:hypothetical protein
MDKTGKNILCGGKGIKFEEALFVPLSQDCINTINDQRNCQGMEPFTSKEMVCFYSFCHGSTQNYTEEKSLEKNSFRDFSVCFRGQLVFYS